MKTTITEKETIAKSDFFTYCKNCGHTRDWHHKGGVLASHLLGVKLGECTHSKRDELKSIFSKRIHCNCKRFEL